MKCVSWYNQQIRWQQLAGIWCRKSANVQPLVLNSLRSLSCSQFYGKITLHTKRELSQVLIKKCSRHQVMCNFFYLYIFFCFLAVKVAALAGFEAFLNSVFVDIPYLAELEDVRNRLVVFPNLKSHFWKCWKQILLLSSRSKDHKWMTVSPQRGGKMPFKTTNTYSQLIALATLFLPKTSLNSSLLFDSAHCTKFITLAQIHLE